MPLSNFWLFGPAVLEVLAFGARPPSNFWPFGPGSY